MTDKKSKCNNNGKNKQLQELPGEILLSCVSDVRRC